MAEGISAKGFYPPMMRAPKILDQTKFLIALHSASLTQLHSGCLLSTLYQFFRVEEVIFRSDVDSALSIITLLLDDSSEHHGEQWRK